MTNSNTGHVGLLAEQGSFICLLKSHFGVQHHSTYMYIHTHMKMHETILYCADRPENRIVDTAQRFKQK